MSSDTDSPRQRTVAELLAAHGETAVTGRRARRRAAEDAGETGQAVIDVSDGAGADAAPPAVNGGGGSPNGSGVSAPAPSPYRNGGRAPRPAPVADGGADNGQGAPGRVNGDANGGPYVNGGGPYGAPTGAAPAPYANGSGDPYRAPAGGGAAPYTNGSGGPYRAPYTNGGGAGAPMPRPGDTYSGPLPPGAGDVAYRAPAVRPGDTFGAPGARPAPRKARRDGGPRDDTATFVPSADSDSAFVNGGAVYADSDLTAYRAAPRTADRPAPREPVTREADAPLQGQNAAPARPTWSPPAGDKAHSRATEQMPRLRSDRTPMLDAGLTGPIEVQRLPQADVVDEGPPTAVGMAPAGAEDWHRERTRGAGRDGGPPTAASVPVFDDDDDLPAGLDAEPGRRRTSADVNQPDVSQSTGQAWAAVVAQWIAGAIGGAALWVGFRFLWRDLPVVALAAAVLVTVGLVLVVRALMRNDDRRTTLFAVLVGLLLTVSPAILVLLGR